MFLDDRCINLLNELIKNPQIKNKELEDKFNLTRRQITYSIGKVNQWLETKSLTPITKSKNGNFIIYRNVFEYLTAGNQSDLTKEYIPTEKERALLIILYLLGKNEEVSLFHITNLLNVSKNTGISDLKEAEKIVEKYQLYISYTRSNGYEIEGDELQIRRLLDEVVKSVLNFYNGYQYFEKFLHIQTVTMTEKIKSVEKFLNIHLTDESYESLPYILELIFRRIEQGHLLKANFHIQANELADTEEYIVSEMLMEKNMTIPLRERIWVTLQLLTSKVRSRDILTDEGIEDLNSAIEQMIHLFEQKSCIMIADKEEILNRLLLHMRPAYYRIKYHLTLKNKFSEKMVEEYTELNDIVTSAIAPLEGLIGEKFPPEEVAFITMCMAGQLIKQRVSLNKKKRALVLCANGLTISKIMQQTLGEVFPEFYFAESLSLRQFQNYKLDYDIVFSTIPVQSEKPSYLVNPLMTAQEKETLRKQVINEVDKESFSAITINRVIETIKAHAIVTDEMALITSLSKLFQEGQKKKSNEIRNCQQGLMQFLPGEFIQIMEEAESWQEAIRLSCQPLLKRKVINHSYIDSLIERNDQEYLYSFLGKRMAIPHASPEEGVSADAFAMLILKKPVTFRNGQQVSIVTPLAIYNQNGHLKALSELVDLAQNEEKVSKMIEATDVSEVLEIMKGNDQERVESDVMLLQKRF